MGNKWHAHKALLRGTAAGVGVLLAASGLAAAPAQAGLLDELLAPVPKIDGIGSIVGEGYGCVSTDSSSLVTCSPLPDDLLSLVSPTVLEAVETPGSGFEFDGWTSCPQAAGAVCTIPVTDLLAKVVQPVANFVPIPGGGGGGGGEEPTDPPAVTIDGWKPGKSETTETTASFQFSMSPAAEGWTFECRMMKLGEPVPWTACASGVSYADLELGDYLFDVRATDNAESPTYSTVASESWTVAEEATAVPAEVTIDSGPAHKGWLTQDFAQFTYTAQPADASVVCRLDGKVKSCSDSSAVLRSLSGRTHTFTVTAIDAEGDWDRARRVFTVPRNNTQLRHSKGDWTRDNGRGHFKGTYSETDKRGSFVKAGAKRIKRIALVVTKGPGYGKVKVMLGKKVLKRVSLNAKKVRKSKLVRIDTFRRPKRGTVRVVVTSRNKTVRIEGLGIASR